MNHKTRAPRFSTTVRAFDLFCGAGGSSVGARAAGVQVVGGVERAKLAARVYEDNFPGAKVFRRDIRSLSASHVAREVGPIDLLLASPECTNHTIAKGKGRRRKIAEVSRRTAFEVIRFAKAMRPRWIVVENVIQMRQWGKYQEWLEQLVVLGYNIAEEVLNAADFGVRQSRRRLFILCDSERVPASMRPAKIRRRAVRPILNLNGVYSYSLLSTKRRAPDTLARARRGIARLGRRKSFLLVYYGTDGAGGWQRLGSPLRTITTVDRFAVVKWEKGRYRMRMLQVPELQKAMGFPQSFKIKHGVRRDKIAMLGNGVCPPVMAAIIKKMLIQEDI